MTAREQALADIVNEGVEFNDCIKQGLNPDDYARKKHLTDTSIRYGFNSDSLINFNS